VLDCSIRIIEAGRRIFGVVPMQQLTWVSGSFPAHLLAARLQSEGIDVQLRGALNAPYGFTVGEMARVDLYVPEDQLDDARLVMLASEVDAALAAPREWAGADSAPPRRWPLWVALGLVVAAGVAPLLRYLADW
jgi:Putative prokaryotic signal transducing protein